MHRVFLKFPCTITGKANEGNKKKAPSCNVNNIRFC